MVLLNRKPYPFAGKPDDLQPEEEVRGAHDHRAGHWRAPGPPHLPVAIQRCLLCPRWPRWGNQAGIAAGPVTLRQHRPHRPAHSPPIAQVWVIEATGEAFRSYEAFLQKKELYSQAVWACKYSGKGGLTLEEALEAEKKAAAALAGVRMCVYVLPGWVMALYFSGRFQWLSVWS